MNNLRIRRAAALLIAAVLLLSMLCACSRTENPDKPEISECAIQHEEEFGGVYILMTIDDFNAKGFAYGDSVNIVFSNGYEMKDLPYYNGYYTATGDPLLVAYPGYPYIKAAINNGEDLYSIAGLLESGAPAVSLFKVAELRESDKATVTLSERGKYADIQNARDIHYTDLRTDYETDEEFANFRSVSAGSIAADRLFRSASPCDNQHSRATYVNDLIEQSGVGFILDLADTDEKIQNYISSPDFSCAYFLSLYEDGKVAPIGLNMNFGSQDFRKKTADGLTAMAQAEGPYLVHCTEGKDRTGFVCLLLEALCGAGYDEIVRDYMITYKNYYRISDTSQKEKYDIIVRDVLLPMVRVLSGDADPQTADLAAGAEKFLLDGGMTQEQIGLLREKLTQ